jgi:hypothetical protein
MVGGVYFDARTYRTLARLAWRERDPGGRRVARMATFVVIPLLASVNAVGWFLDRLLFPGLADVQVRGRTR